MRGYVSSIMQSMCLQNEALVVSTYTVVPDLDPNETSAKGCVSVIAWFGATLQEAVEKCPAFIDVKVRSFNWNDGLTDCAYSRGYIENQCIFSVC